MGDPVTRATGTRDPVIGAMAWVTLSSVPYGTGDPVTAAIGHV